MALFGSDSRTNSEQDNSSANLQNQGSSQSNFDINVKGDDHIEVHSVSTDFGAIKEAIGVVDSVLAANEGLSFAAEQIVSSTNDTSARNLETVGLTLNQGIERGLNTVDDAFASSSGLAELALMEGAEVFNTSAAVVGNAFGDNAALADSAIFNVVQQGQAALDFAGGVVGDVRSIASDALASNERLASEFGANITDVTNSALSFADNQNFLFAETLGQNAETLQSSLTELAVLQERGLDNALDVAASISLDDSAEASTNMVKFISAAAAVVGVALVFRG